MLPSFLLHNRLIMSAYIGTAHFFRAQSVHVYFCGLGYHRLRDTIPNVMLEISDMQKEMLSLCHVSYSIPALKLGIGKACVQMASCRPSYVTACTSPLGAGWCLYRSVGLMSLDRRLFLCVGVRLFKRWGKQARHAGTTGNLLCLKNLYMSQLSMFQNPEHSQLSG